MTVCVRPYSDEDREEFIELHRSVFGSEFSDSLFEWKYAQAPNASSPRIVIAEDENDRVVGAVGSIHAPLAVDGQPITGRSPVDIMVEDEFRSADLFLELIRELREAADEEVAVEFGTGVRRTRLAWQRFGKWEYSDVDRHVRVQRPDDFLLAGGEYGTAESALIRLAGGVFRLGLRLRDHLAAIGDCSWDVLREPGYVAEVFDSFSAPDYPVSIRCDPDFWDWRMSDPKVEGSTYWVSDLDNPVAAVLVATHASENPQCEIALQRSSAASTSQFALLGIYRQIVRDHRHATAVRVTNNNINAITAPAGLNHEAWARRLSESRYANVVEEKLGVNMAIDEVDRFPVGCRWFDERLPEDVKTVPTSQWEYSEYVVD